MNHPPLMQNSHDNGSTAALQLLFTAILTWECIYHFFRYAIKLSLNKHPWIITDTNNNNGSNTTTNPQDTHNDLIQRGPSYATSLLHAIYASTRGILHLYNFHSVSNLDKLHISPSHTVNGITTCRWAHLRVAQTNTIFLSYLLYDLLHIILQYPKLGGVDTILHHALFATCSFINGTYGIMAYPFGWLVVGEISTIFLNGRWFLLKMKRDTTLVNGLFAISFFVTRNVVYTLGMIHLFWLSWEEVRLLREVSGVPRGWLALTVGCMFLGWGLNVVWAVKIWNMVVGGGGSDGSRKKKKQ